MKKNKKIIWGVLLLLAAVAILFAAIVPDTMLGSISLWKYFVAAILVYWLFSKLIWGDDLNEHFQIFLPLALLFVLFKEDIATHIWAGAADVKSWLVIVAAVVLSIAFSCIFGNSHIKTHTPKAHDDTIVIEGEATDKSEKTSHHSNTFHSTTQYLNANLSEHFICNRFGQTIVYFQNTDVGDTTKPVNLKVSNDFGQTVVHIPADWCISSCAENFAGDISIRANHTEGGRMFTLSGKNNFGSVEIISP